MLNYKKFYSLIVVSTIFVLCTYPVFKPYLTIIDKIAMMSNIDIESIFKNTHHYALSHVSKQSFCVTYSIPFLLYLVCALPTEKNEYCLRINSREKILKKRRQHIIVVVSIFTIIFTFIDSSFMMIIFPIHHLIQNEYFIYLLYHGLNMALFYGFIGMLYLIVNDYIKHTIKSVVITYIIIAGSYFLIYRIFELDIWNIVRDIGLFGMLTSGVIDLQVANYYLFNQLLLVSFSCLISHAIFLKKDMIYNEKK